MNDLKNKQTAIEQDRNEIDEKILPHRIRELPSFQNQSMRTFQERQGNLWEHLLSALRTLEEIVNSLQKR